MGFFDATNHLLNFLAPAAGVALFLVLCSVFLDRKVPKPKVFIAQAATIFVACGVCLVAGLWFFGRDGKMATYGLMVLTAATVQWLLQKGWKA